MTSYKVEYSNDGSSFQFYKEQGADKVSEILIFLCMFCVYYNDYQQHEKTNKPTTKQTNRNRQTTSKHKGDIADKSYMLRMFV